MGPSMIGVPHLKHMDSLLGLPNSPFFSLFPRLILHFSHFFMSNEIIVFQFLCRCLKYVFFSLMKVKIINFIQCGP